ncbi:GntR family transcriptional regulator, partial [Oceanicola sp. S124]|uniref:GntR family transcriptional regulator n=1 Tax=Oceanicola sp. S124 TaxID=1042378 RepID=UPI0002558917
MATGPSETLHSRILDELTRKIVDGTWKPGHQLAKETELAAQYGVSRMTMNKVLTRLAQEGYVVRRKRMGTVVAQPRAQSAVLAINDIEDEVTALGRSYRWQLLHREIRARAPEDRQRLDLDGSEGDAGGLFLQGLHLSDGRPFCLEHRVINTGVVPEASAQPFETEVPGQWLLASMPWTKARHHIRAVNVAGRDAELLHL